MPLLNIPQVAETLDRSTVSITIADMRREDTPLIYANPAFTRMTGYPADQILHRNCRFLQGNLENHDARATIRDAISRGVSAQATFENLHRDGERFGNLLLIEPLKLRDGTLVFMVGSQFKITRRTTPEEVGAHSDAVSDEIDRLLTLNERLRAEARKSMSRSAQAAVNLWMKR